MSLESLSALSDDTVPQAARPCEAGLNHHRRPPDRGSAHHRVGTTEDGRRLKKSWPGLLLRSGPATRTSTNRKL